MGPFLKGNKTINLKGVIIMKEEHHPYELYWKSGEVCVIECKKCGFKHLSPKPSEEVLAQFYGKEYFQESFNYSRVTDEYVANITKQIPNNIAFKDVYSKVQELLGGSFESGLRMLDIGCGNNLLSKHFQMKGWEAYVIEPNESAVKYLQRYNLNIYNQLIDGSCPLPVSDLAFVNLQHVLEHLRNPADVLSQVYNSLILGGIIRIVVPNDFSELQLAHHEHYQEPMKWIRYPDHINYFSFSSLTRLLKKYGFKEVYRTASFPVDFFLLAGENYYSDPSVQKRVGPAIRNFEKSFRDTGRKHLLDKFYESLAEQGFGRSIIMYAVKE